MILETISPLTEKSNIRARFSIKEPPTECTENRDEVIGKLAPVLLSLFSEKSYFFPGVKEGDEFEISLSIYGREPSHSYQLERVCKLTTALFSKGCGPADSPKSSI